MQIASSASRTGERVAVGLAVRRPPPRPPGSGRRAGSGGRSRPGWRSGSSGTSAPDRRSGLARGGIAGPELGPRGELARDRRVERREGIRAARAAPRGARSRRAPGRTRRPRRSRRGWPRRSRRPARRPRSGRRGRRLPRSGRRRGRATRGRSRSVAGRTRRPAKSPSPGTGRRPRPPGSVGPRPSMSALAAHDPRLRLLGPAPARTDRGERRSHRGRRGRGTARFAGPPAVATPSAGRRRRTFQSPSRTSISPRPLAPSLAMSAGISSSASASIAA